MPDLRDPIAFLMAMMRKDEDAMMRIVAWQGEGPISEGVAQFCINLASLTLGVAAATAEKLDVSLEEYLQTIARSLALGEQVEDHEWPEEA